MKKLICLIISMLFLCSCSNSLVKNTDKKVVTENNSNDNLKTNLKNKYKKNVKISIDKNLISDNLQKICLTTRKYGSKEEEISLNYLKDILKEYGYIPSIQEFKVYKQTWDSTLYVKNNEDYFKENPYNSKCMGIGKNIIAKRDNHNNFKKTLYLTAHYDTTKDTAGVIDNGTGVTIVLEVARQLKNYDSDFNIEIIFFSAEEYYLSGSRSFVSNLTNKEKKNTIGCINVDMVGQKNDGELSMLKVGKENNIITTMINNQLQNKLPISLVGISDHVSFYYGKIPSITLIDKNATFDIYKKQNTFEYVDLEKLKNTAQLITKFVVNFNMNSYDKLLSKQ